MRRALIAVLIAAAFAMTSVQLIPSASAEPDEVSGTMSQVSTEQLSARMAGPNMFVVNHNLWQVNGDLQGDLVSEPFVIIHTQTGEITVNEWATFAGTWGDLEGTITLRNSGVMVSPGHFHIESTIVKGTGDFAGVCGWGTIDVDMTTSPPSAEYSFGIDWE